MPATVYFATNRVVTPPGDLTRCYTDTIIASSDPAQLTYGRAFVDDANFGTDAVGAITSIDDVRQGGFSNAILDDLQAPGRNLLIFIHGFANSYADAMTRAAFNKQWFAGAGADSTIIAFSWPSTGRVLQFPMLSGPYFADQAMASQSAAHLCGFLATLQPTIAAARASGVRVNLLAHSMGNWALAGAVQHWFSAGRGAAPLFDTAFLAAGDEVYDSFGFPAPGHLSRLNLLAKKVAIYYSIADDVLETSFALNNTQRLGQLGPQNRNDTTLFPASCYTMVDCSGFADYARDFASSHQYYRRSPGVRDAIARLM